MSAPGGPKMDAVSSENKKPSMWEQSMGVMKAFTNEVKKGAKELHQSIQRDWNAVKVQCPRCECVFKWPKEADKVAACGQCGTLVQMPEHTEKAKYHFNTMISSVTQAAKELSGQKGPEKEIQTWHIIVPQGAQGGQQINVTIEGKLYRTIIPEGLREGQTFPISIEKPPKIIATKGKALPLAAGSLVQVVPDNKNSNSDAKSMPVVEGQDMSQLPVIDALVVEEEDDIVKGVIMAKTPPAGGGAK
eukprot:CAMPEP_0167792542 /NCGR_PEP_ID=MMETSP0111_2-20121227/12620_1 /TAXON_ID=91324 /ORGANISM="Lotharella globosa, Strain CCCM811" /LENGTH=245 /DNA_ID=CAMNT_0007685475 /DNA_START=55 /DNA_END=795 /DNA_ORIENTATION=-